MVQPESDINLLVSPCLYFTVKKLVYTDSYYYYVFLQSLLDLQAGVYLSHQRLMIVN